MRRLAWLFAVAFFWSVAGSFFAVNNAFAVDDTTITQGSQRLEFVEGIAIEAEQLLSALLGMSAITLLLWLLLVWGAAYGLRYIAERRWGTPGYFSIISLGINAATLLISFSLVLRHLFRAAPTITTVLIVMGISGVVFGLGIKLRSWIVGMALVLQGQIRRGDRLTLEDSIGIVEKIGLSRLVLRGDLGDVRYVPLSALYERTFSIASPERAYPVEAQIQVSGNNRRESIKTIERLASLCPYRDSRSAVSVVSQVNDTFVAVRFRAWSAEAARRAEAYVRSGYEQTHTPEPGYRTFSEDDSEAPM